MARISTYSNDVVLSADDRLIGTDADNSNATMNFTLGTLLAWVGDNITLDKSKYSAVFGLFNTNGTIVNEDIAFCTGSITITLPSKASRMSGSTTAPLTIKNIGTGTVTLSESVEGETEIYSGESFQLATDGTNWYVL